MKMTIVARNNELERWIILDSIQERDNPFAKFAQEGEQIPIDNLIDFILNPYYKRGSKLREAQKFCLHATLDKYTDVRYYLDHGQN